MFNKSLSGLIGQGSRMLITIFCIPILITNMGIEKYGLWTWATTIISVFQLSEAGLSSGVLYFISEKEITQKSKNNVLTNSIILLLISIIIVTAIILLSSDILLSSIKLTDSNQRTEVIYIIHLGILLIITRIIQNIFWAILQSKQKYELFNFISTIQVILINIFMVILAISKNLYLPNYIIGTLGISITITIFLILYNWKFIMNFKWNYDKNSLVHFIKYNTGVWGSSLGSSIFAQGDKLVIANILGPSMLTIYVVFTNICIQLNQLSAQVTHPIFPLISSIIKDKNLDLKKDTWRNIVKIFHFNVFVSLSGSLFLICFSREILLYFLKTSFEDIYISYFNILCGIYGIYTLSVTGHFIHLGAGLSQKVMIVNLASGIIALTAIYLTSLYLGLLGAIIGNCFYILVIILLIDGIKILRVPTIILKSNVKAIIFFICYILLTIVYINNESSNLLIRSILYLIFNTLLIYKFKNFKKILSL
jgi:O-antigen/teichoic acid export membrane protein